MSKVDLDFKSLFFVEFDFVSLMESTEAERDYTPFQSKCQAVFLVKQSSSYGMMFDKFSDLHNLVYIINIGTVYQAQVYIYLINIIIMYDYFT